MFKSIKERGSYPSFSKLDSLLPTFFNLKWCNKSFPPIPIYEILNNFYLDEGNHRLYLSKLLNKKTIQSEIMRYDYEYFLKNSFAEINPTCCCIIYNNIKYKVSFDEINSYLKIKKDLQLIKTTTYA